MSNLRKILQAMEELHKRQPQPFMHMVQKYCTHREIQEVVLGMEAVGFTIHNLHVITCFKDEQIIWFLHNPEKVKRVFKITTSNNSYAEKIFERIRELDRAQNLDSLYKDFNDFVLHNCIMSYPADGDCADYYNDDWEVESRLEWEIENP